MSLNKTTGNMYEWITHTWNPIKGRCFHDCSYCYMKRWGEQKPVRLDAKEGKTDLGYGNFIFVGSSCDMFAEDIPDDWIIPVLIVCNIHNQNISQKWHRCGAAELVLSIGLLTHSILTHVIMFFLYLSR